MQTAVKTRTGRIHLTGKEVNPNVMHLHWLSATYPWFYNPNKLSETFITRRNSSSKNRHCWKYTQNMNWQPRSVLGNSSSYV